MPGSEASEPGCLRSQPGRRRAPPLGGPPVAVADAIDRCGLLLELGRAAGRPAAGAGILDHGVSLPPSRRTARDAGTSRPAFSKRGPRGVGVPGPGAGAARCWREQDPTAARGAPSGQAPGRRRNSPCARLGREDSLPGRPVPDQATGGQQALSMSHRDIARAHSSCA